VPIRPLVRAGVAALCAAGVVAGVVTYRSERAIEEAKAAYLASGPRQEVVDKYEDSRPLNPDAEQDIGQATVLIQRGQRASAEALIREAIEREPDNARVWAFSASLMLALEKPAEARRFWDRARELNPRLPARMPRLR
jgi:Flp pilus assembly protein TadD